MPDPGPEERRRIARTQVRLGIGFLLLGAAYLVLALFDRPHLSIGLWPARIVVGVLWCAVGVIQIGMNVRKMRAAELELGIRS